MERSPAGVLGTADGRLSTKLSTAISTVKFTGAYVVQTELGAHPHATEWAVIPVTACFAKTPIAQGQH